MEEFGFERLMVYQKSLDSVSDIYEVIKNFPLEEKYALSDQLRRAVTSITLNIAEGYGLSALKFKQHLQIAKGSLREVIAILAIAKKQEYISTDTGQAMRNKLSEIARMISGLCKKVAQQ